MDRVEVVYGDTDLVPSSGVTGGSRSLQIAGSAVHQAAGTLVELATERRRRAARGQRRTTSCSTPSRGAFHVVGSPAVSVGWADVGAGARRRRLLAVSDFSAPDGPRSRSAPTWPWSRSTPRPGRSSCCASSPCDDAGTILNPLLVDGQVHGGIAQGVAQALLEEVVYDDDGNPLTSTFADYAIPSAAELPSFELVAMETPTPLNPLGAKGIGESGTIGATPAVQNAVVDALAHLGVRHIDMPLTPERVWRAITSAGAA